MILSRNMIAGPSFRFHVPIDEIVEVLFVGTSFSKTGGHTDRTDGRTSRQTGRQDKIRQDRTRQELNRIELNKLSD